MNSRFQLSSPPVLGADFLRFLLTPECVDPEQPPTEEQWPMLDFSRYGKTEPEIKQFLEQKAQAHSGSAEKLTGYFYADLLNQAMNKGLIYRLNNPQEDGKAYYGVPSHVREALALKWLPEGSEALLSKLSQAKTGRPALMALLKMVLQQAALIENLEIREYAAQVALNALHQQDLLEEEIPVSLLQLGQALGLIAVPHYADLTVLLEACVGTPLLKSVRQLCDAAVDANLLPAEDVDAVLNPLPAPAANPFMVLT